MSVVGETLSINAWSESSWVDLHCSTLKECATQDEILLSPQWDTICFLLTSTVRLFSRRREKKANFA